MEAERGGREPPTPTPRGHFYFCFSFSKPRRTVRESYQGFHSRDFAFADVIFSKTASTRGPFRFSSGELLVSSSVSVIAISGAERFIPCIHLPVLPVHCFIRFPIYFYISAVFVPVFHAVFSCFLGCFVVVFLHEPHKQHQRVMTDSTKESRSHCSPVKEAPIKTFRRRLLQLLHSFWELFASTQTAKRPFSSASALLSNNPPVCFYMLILNVRVTEMIVYQQ